MDTRTADEIRVSQPKTSWMEFVRTHFRDYGMMLSLLVIMLFFQVVTDGTLLQAAEPDQPGAAEQLHRHHGAGHAARHRGRAYRSFGRLHRRLRRRTCRRDDGAVGHRPVTTTIACLIVGGIIGAAQGYWVAYFKVPSFIVTLAGMLVFKGLTLALLGGMSVGPFPVAFQRLSSGFIPDVFGGEGFNYTSLFLGTASVAALIYFSFRSRAKQLKHAVETAPFGLFALQERACWPC